MTRNQAITARALLGWSPHVVSAFERDGRVRPSESICKDERSFDRLTAIRTALKAASVEFTKSSEPGVKLRKPAS